MQRLDTERLQAKLEEKELYRARIYALNQLMRRQEWAVFKQYENGKGDSSGFGMDDSSSSDDDR